MASVTYLDTHVVAWLYGGQLARFPSAVRQMLSTEELLVSPMVVLELQYLFEIGRTTKSAQAVMHYLQARIGLQVCDKGFDKVIIPALQNDWIRDPFDRIIVAQASMDESQLITKDELIRAHYSRAVWD